MLLVRQFFGADAHDSVDTRSRPPSLIRSTPSLIRQPLGDYSKYIRGTWCSSVVFEREAREFQSFHTAMFKLRHKTSLTHTTTKITRKKTNA